MAKKKNVKRAAPAKKKTKRAPAQRPAAKRKRKKAPALLKPPKVRQAKKPTSLQAKDPLGGFLVTKGPMVLRASFDGALELGDFPLSEVHVFDTKGEAQKVIASEIERFANALPATPGTSSLLANAEVVSVKSVYALSFYIETVPARAGDEFRVVARTVRVGDSPVSLPAALKAHGDEFRRQFIAAKQVAKQTHLDASKAYEVSVDADDDAQAADLRLEDYLAWAKYDARQSVVLTLG